VPNFAIRRFSSGDELPLNDLYNRVFEQNRPLEEWQWKFDANRVASGLPFQVINVAEAKGRVLGQFPSMTARFKFHEHEVMLAQGVDTAVDPDHRSGAKVIVELARAHRSLLAEAGILFGYGLPNKAHYSVGKWLLSYRDLCPLLTLRLRLNWRHTLRRLSLLPHPILEWAGRIIAAARLARLALIRTSAVQVKEVLRFDSSVDEFWDRTKNQYGILAVRDSRYLNWRYADRPRHTYCILRAESNGRMEGYIVVRMSNQGGDRVGLVMDLLVSDGEVGRALVQSALKWFLARGADYTLCRLVPGDGIISTLRACGFREHPAFPRLQVVYGPHEPADRLYPYVNDPLQWHLVYGDFDGQ
jgi:hypothetical protein